MPKCGRCGNDHVLSDTVRVLYPEDVDRENLPGCPMCSTLTGSEWHRKSHGRDTEGYQKPPNAHEPGGGPDDPTLRPLDGGEP